MLRAVASIYTEGQALALIRRDGFKLFRLCNYSNVPVSEQTVLSGENKQVKSTPGSVSPSHVPPRPPPPPPPPRRSWPALAALAVTASLGGVYFYRKLNNGDKDERRTPQANITEGVPEPAERESADPTSASALPRHAQYLLVGGGTAAFAAMRAIRSSSPEAHVLMVAEEFALPYMRPPLSKEVWRELDLAERASNPDDLTFRQWNGRRRGLVYEPSAFYLPSDEMGAGGAGVALARGWRVTRLDPDRRVAELTAGDERHELTYDAVLLATGSRPRRLAVLRGAAAAGRSLVLRGVRDVARLARALEDPAVRTVAVLGGGFLASELSAALADRLRGSGRRVVQLFREEAPLAGVLPPYLAQDTARRLAEAGVELLPRAEVVGADVEESEPRVSLRLGGGAQLAADLVVECVGSEPAAELAKGAGLELHDSLGGVLVNSELQARTGVWAAGDVACFYDESLGRRRVEHHDHAVLSGRRAGENMAGPPSPYRHQSMFWSDLGPTLGYEAIGIIDSRLPTYGVFSADAVTEVDSIVAAESAAASQSVTAADSTATSENVTAAESTQGTNSEKVATNAESALERHTFRGEDGVARRFDRGVVLYLRDERVVGVLLWNLFNRMHVARQVLNGGHFDDLFEVCKLFSLHEDD